MEAGKENTQVIKISEKPPVKKTRLKITQKPQTFHRKERPWGAYKAGSVTTGEQKIPSALDVLYTWHYSKPQKNIKYGGNATSCLEDTLLGPSIYPLNT